MQTEIFAPPEQTEVISFRWSISSDLLNVLQSLKQQQLKFSELMEICQQKEDVINKLQAALDDTVESATRDVSTNPAHCMSMFLL